MSDLTRRTVLGLLGAAAGAEWGRRGYDPRGEDGAVVEPGRVTHQQDLAELSGRLQGTYGGMTLERGAFDGALVTLITDLDGVYINLDGGGESGQELGVSAVVSAEAARELAVALYMAAEEQEAHEDV